MTALPSGKAFGEDERSVLLGYLAYFRAVLARKAEGVNDDDARRAACPPSPLTLLGLVRHMTDVNGEPRPYAENIAWTGVIGNVALPSAVPPIGRTASGLPVGVQVVAPFLHDRTAVRVAGLLGSYEPPPSATA